MLQNKLDDNIASKEELRALRNILSELYSVATKAIKPTDKAVELYLGASFSFENGNAHRPDIASNATLSEFSAWKQEYSMWKRGNLQTEDNKIPQFRVSGVLT